MSTCDQLEYSDNYLKTSKVYDNIVKDVPNNALKVSKYFRRKIELIRNNNSYGNNNLEVVAPLKYLSTFQRTLLEEISLINCEIDLTCSADCVIPSSTTLAIFEITDTWSYVLVVTLSIENNSKLLQQ